ncbi:MAG: class I SAM-dependent methyltransferase [Anaerolineales bacterium]|nr:class I SAM-dependent methyltransferase [Anaerolineales bacterium]
MTPSSAAPARELALGLCCPACGADLPPASAEPLVCAQCQAAWPLVSGVRSFSPEEAYWGEVPQAVMQQVNARAAEAGWEAALAELVQPSYPDIYRYVVSAGRVDWAYFSRLTAQSHVLDLGSGWGPISYWLAPRVNQVTSVENVVERAAFQALRFRQSGRTNVTVLQASVHALPLQSGQFDLAIMNGLLEWVAVSKRSAGPREIQLEVLRRIHGLLRPGGEVYIGIENRFGYQYFLRAPDHTGLPFTSLMPRWLANAYLGLRRHFKRAVFYNTEFDDYRTYTYSARGYQRLLTEAGFRNVRTYIVAPDYNNPLVMYLLGDRQMLQYYLEALVYPRTLKQQIAISMAHIPWLPELLAPCFALFARRD